MSGDLTIDIMEGVLNPLMPKLPVLLMAYFTYWLMAKKKWGTGKIMLLMLAMSIVGYFTTILA